MVPHARHEFTGYWPVLLSIFPPWLPNINIQKYLSNKNSLFHYLHQVAGAPVGPWLENISNLDEGSFWKKVVYLPCHKFAIFEGDDFTGTWTALLSPWEMPTWWKKYSKNISAKKTARKLAASLLKLAACLTEKCLCASISCVIPRPGVLIHHSWFLFFLEINTAVFSVLDLWLGLRLHITWNTNQLFISSPSGRFLTTLLRCSSESYQVIESRPIRGHAKLWTPPAAHPGPKPSKRRPFVLYNLGLKWLKRNSQELNTTETEGDRIWTSELNLHNKFI